MIELFFYGKSLNIGLSLMEQSLSENKLQASLCCEVRLKTTFFKISLEFA